MSLPDVRPQRDSSLQHAIKALADHESLSEEATAEAFGAVMRGEATPAQTAALLAGMRIKGETPEELAGVVRAVRKVMIRVVADAPHLVDICGTGGGNITTFNISTAAAFVAAGAGATVAKHGSRSCSGANRCGSADVLEALRIAVGLDAEATLRVLQHARIALLYSPTFHPAMRFIGPVHQELAIPTVMRMVGPLANPACVPSQVVGVADRNQASLMAHALARLDTEHALVVHARAGMDEISPVGITDVWEIRQRRVIRWDLDPAAYDLAFNEITSLRGGGPAANALRLERLISGDRNDSAGRAAVLLNGGAAIYVAGLASTLGEAVQLAESAVDRGGALIALNELRRLSSTSMSDRPLTKS